VRAPAHLLDRDLRADVVLADLGFSSAQMDDPGRGMSFRADGPLDMRLDPDGPMTAADLLAELDEPELARLLRTTGEEPLARPIARKLVGARAMEPITTTRRLAELVREAYGGRAQRSRMDPATRTFMALRIAVNDELGALDRLLEQVETAARSVAAGEPAWLRPAARIGIIGFHSLEDRRTKQAFRRIAATVGAEVRTPKPVTAGEVEIRANPRSRSAKLRVIRLPGGSGRIGERL